MEFDDDELVQVWVVRHLQIIGEAAGRLSDNMRRQQPDVPWRKIIRMRSVLVHGYFEVDLRSGLVRRGERAVRVADRDQSAGWSFRPREPAVR